MKPSPTLLACLVTALSFLAAPAPAQDTPATRPAKLAEAQDFAKRLHDGCAKGDVSVMAAALDGRFVFEKAIAGLTLAPDFKRGLMAGSSSIREMATQIEQQIRQGGSYRLLRVREVGGQPRALFRLLNEQGLNYHDLHLAADDKNDVKIVDIEIYAAGELMSDMVRRMLMPALAQQHKGVLARLRGVDQAYIDNLPKVTQMRQLGQQGKHAEAVAVYDAFPASLQKERTVMLLWVMQHPPLGDEKYAAALEKYRQTFPDAANVDLMGMDFFILKGRYDDALAAIDRLDKRLGGDPHLNVPRARAHEGKKDPAKARAVIEEAIKADPRLDTLHWELVEQAIRRKDWPAVAERLTQIRKELGIEIDPANLKNAPVYAEFVKTPEYQKWAQQQAN